MEIRKAGPHDINAITRLMLLLYKESSFEELQEENISLLIDDNQIVFLASENGNPVGFAHCAARTDYVEGTESSPVGYLEGIFVLPDFQNNGIGRALVLQCESWAKSKGFREFASDCELDNTDSYRFHLELGFQEANRIICFTKKL